MPRLTDLDDLLFPVATHPVFVNVTGPNGEKRLAVPDKKAIISQNCERVLGIVSREYRLVSNREALELGYECCRIIFPETTRGEWQVSAIDAPGTASYCHIDLSHNSTVLDFGVVSPEQRPEVFGPFIRVTNSYNGIRALAFNIGFFRKVCKNGMILADSVIRFRFNHLKRDMGERVRFEISHKRLAELKSKFNELVSTLRECRVRRAEFEPVICHALSLPQSCRSDADDGQLNDCQVINSHVTGLSEHYACELGENAYAVFNAVTDFASHPPISRCVRRDRHSLQRLAGSWLTAFSHECRKPGFTIARYLDETTEPEGTSETRNSQKTVSRSESWAQGFSTPQQHLPGI